MSMPLAPNPASRRNVWAVGLFIAIFVLGVFYAKWDPYYLKAFYVASHHTLGASIVTGHHRSAPPVGLSAAIHYTVAYFKDIWIALVVGLLVGAGVQTLLPTDWLMRILGRRSVAGRGIALAAAVPSMMCTCCSAPIAVSLAKRQVSYGAILAYWLGNPVLNPATIIFMGFVLGWNWALYRIVMGLLLVVTASWLGDRWGTANGVNTAPPASDTEPPSFGRFVRVLGKLAIGLLPEYLVLVALLGATRAWLFPAMSPALGHSLGLMLILAVAGTLFVIPTAGEIPIVQTLMGYGLGIGSAATLMMVLPAISLPSMAMVGQGLPKKLLLTIALLVVLMGILTGLLAPLVL